jgi:hypothetical protein
MTNQTATTLNEAAVGPFGDISVIHAASGSYRAEAHYRYWDGRVRKVTTAGPTKRAAEFALREKLSTRMRVGANGGLRHDQIRVTPLRPATSRAIRRPRYR